MQSSIARKLTNELDGMKHLLDQQQADFEQERQRLQAELALAAEKLEQMGILEEELKKAKQRLLDPSGGGNSVPYAEFAGLEAQMEKITNVVNLTMEEFGDTESIKQIVDINGTDKVAPQDVLMVSR